MIKIDTEDWKVLCEHYGCTDFTEGGFETLFDYLNDDGIEVNFDPIILREWTEYTKEELIKEYGEKEEETVEDIVDRLQNETIVLETEGDTYLLQDF